MCFSPEASFISGGILTALGINGIYKTQNKEKFIAAIPLFFGAQQLTEGILWLTFLDKINPIITLYVTYLYLFFALIFWPTWIPISILIIEKDKLRKKILYGVLFIGIIISLCLIYSLIKYGATSSINGHHISYKFNTLIEQNYGLIAYTICVTLPFFISSKKKLIIFGVLVLASLAVTYIFYYYWLTSIWCFFAAILSCSIYLMITRKN